MFNGMPEGTRKGLLAESIQLCHQFESKGQYIHASPLPPAATVTDVPFMDTKDPLAGYFLADAEDQEEAIRIAKRVPGARVGTIEVRLVRVISGLPDKQLAKGRAIDLEPVYSTNGQAIIFTKESCMSKITPLLWFDAQAEEAARFYTSCLPPFALQAEIHGPQTATLHPILSLQRPITCTIARFRMKNYTVSAVWPS